MDQKVSCKFGAIVENYIMYISLQVHHLQSKIILSNCN